MSGTNAFNAKILEHYFNNAIHSNVGDAGGLDPSTGNGDMFVSLHTADPTETGDQTSSELTYTEYARQAVDRDGAAWTVTTADPANVDNAAAVTFPERIQAGSETATHFGIGFAVSGVGELYFFGALTSDLVVTPNVQPEFAIGELNITLD
jgi:hypothetical protein